MRIKKRGLEKLVKKAILGVVGISMLFSSSKCYSTVPITKTPLYKYLITHKISSKYQEESLESEEQNKIIEKQPEKKAEIISADKIYKSSNKPIYKISSDNKPIHQSHEKINKNPDLSALHPDMPFSEAIDIFRRSTSPPLNIVVLWRDLEENSDVYMDTPIGIDSISGISLGTYLELMLMAVSSDPKSLGYVIDKGVITIATQDSLPRKKKTRVYDITDLVGQPANYFTPPMPMMGLGGMGYGGMGMGYGRGYGASGMMPGMGMPFGGMMPGRGMGAYGGRGYGGYGQPFGGGYGMPSGGMGYGGSGGYGYGGQPYGGYRGYGRSFITGGYGTRIGSIPTGTSLNVNPYIMGNYVMGNYRYNRSQELADLIEASTSRRR